MARLSDSACLLLAAAVLLSASVVATARPAASDCANATFQARRSYQRCSNLPVLSATLHWMYHGENGMDNVSGHMDSPDQFLAATSQLKHSFSVADAIRDFTLLIPHCCSARYI
uniref:Uncharacterized protein n=1 Tax=Leersia perrieri TaxID=77586 RepID=A0A0D9VQN9_9ORYZ